MTPTYLSRLISQRRPWLTEAGQPAAQAFQAHQTITCPALPLDLAIGTAPALRWSWLCGPATPDSIQHKRNNHENHHHQTPCKPQGRA